MMAAVGAAALVWFLVPLVWRLELSRRFECSGVAAGRDRRRRRRGGAVRPRLHPAEQATPRERGDRPRQQPVRIAVGLRPVALQPKGIVFTFVDLGPRLITVTHHDAITGPYHRNGSRSPT